MVYRGRRGTDPVLTSEQDGHWLDTRFGCFISNSASITQRGCRDPGSVRPRQPTQQSLPYRETIPVQFYQTILALRFRPVKFHRGTPLIGDVFISYDRWNI